MIYLFLFNSCSLTYQFPSVQSRKTWPRKVNSPHLPSGMTEQKQKATQIRGKSAHGGGGCQGLSQRPRRRSAAPGGRASAGDAADRPRGFCSQVDLGNLKVFSGTVRLVMVCAREHAWDICCVFPGSIRLDIQSYSFIHS